MSTISNLNIVIQQGDHVREANNDRLQPQHINQVGETILRERENELEMTKVQESDEYAELNPDGKNRHEKRLKYLRKKKAKREGKKSALEKTGRLIDTLV